MEKRRPYPYLVLKQILLKQGITKISYDELLWTDEWLTFREEIKERDNETCTKCLKSQFKEMTDEEFSEVLAESGYGKYFNLLEGRYEDYPSELSLKKNRDYPSRFKIDTSVKLEVHHKYYVWNQLPWEYELDALTTLCDKCHENEHTPVVYSDSMLRTLKELSECSRCGGKGYIKEYEHVQNGICFACGGLGGVLEGSKQNFIDISSEFASQDLMPQYSKQINELQNRLSELIETSKQTFAAMLELQSDDTDTYDLLARGVDSINIEITDICNELRAYGVR